MGRQVRRVAPNDGPARIGEQGQSDQVWDPRTGIALMMHVSRILPSDTADPLMRWSHRHQHENTIQALSWAPHGNLLASASRDQTMRVFDIRPMKELVVLRGHKKEVCCTLCLTL